MTLSEAGFGTMKLTGPPTLRDRLFALRRDALQQLDEAEGGDSGLLRLVADASVVLHALDAEQDLPR